MLTQRNTSNYLRILVSPDDQDKHVVSANDDNLAGTLEVGFGARVL